MRPRMELCVVAIVSIGFSAVTFAQSGSVKTNPFIDYPPGTEFPATATGGTPEADGMGILGVALIFLAMFVAICCGLVALRIFRADKYARLMERRNQWALKTRRLQSHYDKYTIRRATRCYIWPKCSSSVESAPADESETAMPAASESLRETMDAFLEPDHPERYMLILGEPGAGKTSFLLNYLLRNLFKLRNRCHIQLVHLGTHDCDDVIANVRNPTRTALFLDALDEDLIAIEHGHHERLVDLMEMSKEFLRVVITSRTRFFPAEEEIPKYAGISRMNRPGPDEDGDYEFIRYELAAFDDDEIEAYLASRYSILDSRRRKQAFDFAMSTVPKLCARPLLLSYVPDVVGAEQGKIETAADLYAAIVDVWLERESAGTSGKEALRQFSEKLAFDIFSKRGSRLGEKIPKREMTELASNWNFDIPFPRVSERSLLNRDAEGNYKFAHRSILEYLFVEQLLKEPLAEGVVTELTDMTRQFLSDRFEIDVAELPRVTLYATCSADRRNATKASTMSVNGRDFLIEENGAIWASGILGESGGGWVVATIGRAIQDGLYGGSKRAACEQPSWTKGGSIADVGLTRAYIDAFPAVRGSSWLDDSPLAVVITAPQEAAYLLPGGFAACHWLSPNDELALTLTGPGAWDVS